MADPNVDCAALEAEITTLQAEFEGLWLAVSRGAAPTARYRELRHMLDERRAVFARNCGTPHEATTLPRSITADWHEG